MITAVIVIHVLTCIALVIMVLLQQGKGADVGAVFGGSSQTVFGSSGAGGIMVKLTWLGAAIFFSTSLLLAYTATGRVSNSIFNTTIPSTAPLVPRPASIPAAPKPAANGSANVPPAPAAAKPGAPASKN